MKITVDIRTVYGVDKIYPHCEKAKLFCGIAGTTTLTTKSVKAIKALGYQIVVANTKTLGDCFKDKELTRC